MIQVVALPLAVLLAGAVSLAIGKTVPLLIVAVVQGLIACALSRRFGAERWWRVIHLAFMPALFLCSGLGIAPSWFLAGFALLVLTYWNSARSQVPLYLSNATTARALGELLERERATTLIDAGCGTGSLAARVARARPACRVIGLENAPLPALIAWLRVLPIANCRVRFGDFWGHGFDGAQVVYAFLSPVPMARLWQKCCAEMPPGTLLVSNSFEVPDVSPDEVITLDDGRATRLLCYRIAPGRPA